MTMKPRQFEDAFENSLWKKSAHISVAQSQSWGTSRTLRAFHLPLHLSGQVILGRRQVMRSKAFAQSGSQYSSDSFLEMVREFFEIPAKIVFMTLLNIPIGSLLQNLIG